MQKHIILSSSKCSYYYITFKKDITSNFLTNIIDYRDDGFQAERTKGFISNNTFKEKFDKVLNADNCLKKVLKYDETWYVLENNNIEIVKKSNLASTHLQIDYLEKLLYLKNNISSIDLEEKFEDEISWRLFKVSELFEILTKPKEEYNKDLIGHKYVFQCAAKNNNNGVKDIVKATKNTFTKNKIVLVVGGDGGSGLAYYLSKDFIISSSVKVLSPLETINLSKNIGIFISLQLSENKKIYNRGHIWKNELILNTKINLPILSNDRLKINYNYIDSLYN